jgi:outer membrane protein OmpA-like peptidoglycan-associated protein
MALKKQMHQQSTENIVTARGFSKARIGVHHAVFAARWLVGCLMLLLSSYALAVTFHPRMDEALWETDSAFGSAVFEQNAGQALRFYLYSPANPLAKGQAVLTSQAPRWNPDLADDELGLVNVLEGSHPVELESAMANRLVAELYAGKSPRFLRRAWYAQGQAVEVAMSSVAFRSAYVEYQQCLSALSPVGFDQLERSRVQFDSDKAAITSKAQEWLNTMADYLSRATDVEQLFIDGHTDNTHNTSYNSELSRRRAEAVADYLASKGISRNQLTVRFHGERFPVSPNTSVAGKADNRRVTLRVERVPQPIAQR